MEHPDLGGASWVTPRPESWDEDSVNLLMESLSPYNSRHVATSVTRGYTFLQGMTMVKLWIPTAETASKADDYWTLTAKSPRPL